MASPTCGTCLEHDTAFCHSEDQEPVICVLYHAVDVIIRDSRCSGMQIHGRVVCKDRHRVATPTKVETNSESLTPVLFASNK